MEMGRGAVEGNVKLSELMVVSFVEIRDTKKELVGGGWVLRSVWGVLNQSEIGLYMFFFFYPTRQDYLRARIRSAHGLALCT